MDTWPDIDNGVICGDCYALINIYAYGTCRTYCKSIGLGCRNAFDDVGDSCNIKQYHGTSCDTDFNGPTLKTSDALCECKNDHGSTKSDTL